MKTNNLKKGARIRLRCGWYATIEDNMRGNTRLATVEGLCTEMGSVYSHDITSYRDEFGAWHEIEHTPAQLELKARVEALGF